MDEEPEGRTSLDGDNSREVPPREETPTHGRVKKLKVRKGSRGTGTRGEGADVPHAPEALVMEPILVRDDAPRPLPASEGGEGAEVEGPELVQVDVERDVIGTGLYRERRIVGELVEEEVLLQEEEGTRRDRGARADRGQRGRKRAGRPVGDSMASKFFYDLVCNRMGVMIAGFGMAMILFTMAYDHLQGQELSFGLRHTIALAISIAVYLFGMAIEMLRVWSWQCEGAETEEEVVRARPAAHGDGSHSPTPMIPEDALGALTKGEDGEREG